VKLLKLLTILALLTSGALSGCSPREVYLSPGQIAEVARGVKVYVWITNKATGKRERRVVRANPGWYVGRPKSE